MFTSIWSLLFGTFDFSVVQQYTEYKLYFIDSKFMDVQKSENIDKNM